MINIIKYITSDGKCPFDEWFSKLKDPIGKAAILNRFDRVKKGNLGDHKDVGDGVYELRFFTGPGYRIYYAWEGEQLVLLLTAGSKSQQSKEIQQAKTYWLEHRAHKMATAEFRTSDYLDSPETIAAYLEMAMEDTDPAMLMMALRNIAEAKGMKEVAGETGLNLQTLYRTLSDKGNPTLQTLTSLLHTFGLRLAVKSESATYSHA